MVGLRVPAVQVIATNYAYQGVPATPEPDHRVNLVNRAPNRTSGPIPDQRRGVQPMPSGRLPEEKRNRRCGTQIRQREPGSRNGVASYPGAHGMACFQLRGATPLQPGTGPSHSELGMVAEFTVP